MALNYKCNIVDGKSLWNAASLARSDLGLDAYLVGSGPSLAQVEPALLAGPGLFVLGLKESYPRVRPSAWLGMDDPARMPGELFREPFPKLLSSIHAAGRTVDGRPVADMPQTYFLQLQDADESAMFRARGHRVRFVYNRNSFAPALHYLIWIGARRIHLVGCDFGGAADYHDGRAVEPAQRSDNRKLYAELVEMLRWWHEVARRHGVTLVSCTPGSPVNEFLPCIELERAIDMSRARVGVSGAAGPAQPAEGGLHGHSGGDHTDARH